jgi:O-antigen biosynthesis protein WbqP
MKKVFDIFCGILLLVALLPIMILTGILIKLTSKGAIIYFSDRVGKNNIIFKMPKFRTMKTNTPAVATHLLDNPQSHLTSIGGFLRKTSIDELPQLWSVLTGKMSFVGPRPALFNQNDLIDLRKKNNIDKILPGITGWAQINGRDEISIEEKVDFEIEYLHKKSFLFDMKILLLTFFKIFTKNGVSH